MKDGGSAFPRPFSGTSHRLSESQDGMSLRDYFAAAALQGMLHNGFVPTQSGFKAHDKDVYTRAAFKLADEMLKEREK